MIFLLCEIFDDICKTKHAFMLVIVTWAYYDDLNIMPLLLAAINNFECANLAAFMK